MGQVPSNRVIGGVRNTSSATQGALATGSRSKRQEGTDGRSEVCPSGEACFGARRRFKTKIESSHFRRATEDELPDLLRRIGSRQPRGVRRVNEAVLKTA